MELIISMIALLTVIGDHGAGYISDCLAMLIITDDYTVDDYSILMVQ